MSEYTLHLGDCLEYMRALPDGAFDAVVTDPPYGVGLRKQVSKRKTIDGSYNSWSDEDEETHSLVSAAILECVRIARAVIITPGIRLLQRYPPARDIGTIFMPTGSGCGPWGFNCNNPILYYGKDPYLSNGLGSRPNSVSATHWFRRNDSEHPTEKPIGMMLWLVSRASVFPGDTIFDPFMGSGTTGVACMQLGRNFVGCEIDPEYYAIAEKRISEAAKQPPLFVQDAPKETPVQRGLLDA